MVKTGLYQAILKSVVGRFSIYLIQVISLVITARIFGPKDFGIIASIQVFVVFFQMLGDVGIGPAIINEDRFGKNKRDGIFTVTALIGIVLAVVFYLFSFALNGFYGGYEYQQIALLVCVSIFFSSLSIISITAMNKDTKFIHLAACDIISEIVALGCIMYLYSKGFGVLALAARPAVQSTLRFSIVYYLSKNTTIGRPSFGLELFHIKSIFSFSIYQFGFNFINYFSKNLDNILVGKFFGLSYLGIYDRAYQLMRYPLMLTTFAMTPAIQPILTKIKHDKSRVAHEHAVLCKRLLLISLPICLFIYLNSNSIVLFMFGDEWVSVEPVIKIFSLIIPIQTVVSVSGSFYQVMNKTKLLFCSGVICSISNIIGISIGIYLGDISYVAISVVCSYSINFFVIKYILIKYCFFKSMKDFFINILKAFVVLPSMVIYTIGSLVLDIDISPFINLMLSAALLVLSLLISYKPLMNVMKESQ